MHELEASIGQISVVSPLTTGLSSASVWKVEASRPYALKGFHRLDVAFERLGKIHQFQQLLKPLAVVPELKSWRIANQRTAFPTLLIFEDRFWELSTWLEGIPKPFDEFDDASCDRVARVLATAHHASVSAFQCEMFPAGVSERIHSLERIPSVIRSRDVCHEHDMGFNASSIGFLVEHWQRHHHRLRNSLMRLLMPAKCFWIFRDLRREHLLFTGNSLNGIIDLGAARPDLPVFDLVRFLCTSVLVSGTPGRKLFGEPSQNRDSCGNNAKSDGLFASYIPEKSAIERTADKAPLSDDSGLEKNYHCSVPDDDVSVPGDTKAISCCVHSEFPSDRSGFFEKPSRPTSVLKSWEPFIESYFRHLEHLDAVERCVGKSIQEVADDVLLLAETSLLLSAFFWVEQVARGKSSFVHVGPSRVEEITLQLKGLGHG